LKSTLLTTRLQLHFAFSFPLSSPAPHAPRHLSRALLFTPMSVPRPFAGLGQLLDLGMSYVEEMSPTISTGDLRAIRDVFARFLGQEASFSECQGLVLSIIHRDSPLVRLREILTLPEEPLPSPAAHGAEESAAALRRRTHSWSSAEDQRLLAGVARFGVDNWQKVAAFVGSGRNRAQCSQRWARGLNPRISRKTWTRQEEGQLLALVREYGHKRWAKIASIMGNRSDVQCRYHYQQIADAPGARSPLPLPIRSGFIVGEERIGLATGGALAPAPRPMQWRVVGCDSDSLNSFLRHFQ
jgi:hypothetical protein